MKKYKIVFSYCMALDKEIKAKNENEALEKMQNWIDTLSNEKFCTLGQPQLAENQIEEIN